MGQIINALKDSARVLLPASSGFKIPTRPRKHFITAWFVGIFIYLWIALPILADAGILAIPFQIVIGAIFSAFFVTGAFVLGYLLRVPLLYRIWYATPISSISLFTLAIAALIYAPKIGWTVSFKYPGDDYAMTFIDPLVAWGSLAVAIFSTLHFSFGQAFFNRPPKINR